jgi:hypothetical protein
MSSAHHRENSLWDRIHELPASYRSTPWDELILDALARLPHVGAAVVLGFSALEVRIEAALNDLARLYGVRPEVWEWINDRGPKEPAIIEQFDSLLKAVTGRSLKEDGTHPALRYLPRGDLPPGRQ